METVRATLLLAALSVDPLDSHTRWSTDIEETQGYAPNYPMIGDHDLRVSKLYGMLPATAGERCEGRTAMDNATVRNVYVIGPDKKVKLLLSHPMSTGRNFDEVLRVLDSMQMTAKQGGHAGELEARRQRDHSAGHERRRGEGTVPRGLESAEAVPSLRSAAKRVNHRAKQ